MPVSDAAPTNQVSDGPLVTDVYQVRGERGEGEAEWRETEGKRS